MLARWNLQSNVELITADLNRRLEFGVLMLGYELCKRILCWSRKRHQHAVAMRSCAPWFIACTEQEADVLIA